MIDDLQDLLKCPREYFSITVDQAIYIFDGKQVDGPPMVEVSWFDRGQEVQDLAAKIITKHTKTIGCENLDVIFFPLKENNYYENGEHF
jgi:hypothetical protein